MLDFLTHLFDTSGFPPRWYCGRWSDGHGWLHILSDLAIWSAYFAIPCILVFFALRRRDVPFRKIFWLFGAFILACGTTHLMEAIIFWHPVYRLAGVIKLLTAGISWGTVIALVPIVPKALAMRAPHELEREIAARREAEAALKQVNAELEKRVQERTAELVESQRREKERADELETILRATPTPIWIAHDPECHRITGNPAAVEFLGVSEGANVSATSPGRDPSRRGFREYRGNTPIPPNELPIQQAVRGTPVIGAEFDFVFDDGRVRYMYGNAVPLRNADGVVHGSVAAFADVTPLKEAHAQLREADQRKDEFLATLAHELRNPLAPIRNAIQILHMNGLPESEWHHCRDIIDRQAQQLSRLVDDLLDVSRISRGKINLQKEPSQLTPILNDAIDATRPLIEAKRHDLILSVPAEPIHLVADATRLTQVFSNLLDNAAKYTDLGGRISVTAEREGGEVIVTVKDTGAGIPGEKLPRLFVMFSPVEESRTHAQGGLGIGLHLVKRLVEMHGGSVTARSDGPGHGSEFEVRLPVRVEASGASVPATKDPPAELKSSLRVLVVDDNPDVVNSIEVLLRLMGNETWAAHDGEEAVAAAKEFRPDVVLLDIGLPTLDGYEVCRRIREQPWGQGMRIIAVTGWGQEEDRRRSHEAGFDEHLVKPVNPQSLMLRLAELPAGRG